MTAIDAINLMLETVTEVIPKQYMTEDTLAKQFTSTRATKTSTRAFRLVGEYATVGDSQAINIDGGTVPVGSNPQWWAGAVLPAPISVSTNWTDLVARVGQKVGGNVAIMNPVTDAIQGIEKQMKNMHDILLMTDGMGSLATVSTVNTGTKTYTLATTPFGSRLLNPGQSVDIVNPATNIKRGTLTIFNVFNFLGGQPSFTYTTPDVPGAAASDIVRFGSLTDGAPQGINGLRYMVTTATTGNLHGVPRTFPYVVANGFDNGAGAITLTGLKLAKYQVRQRLGSENTPKGHFWLIHPTQQQSFDEMGYDRQFIPLAGGDAAGFDPFFKGKRKIDEDPVVDNLHCDQTAWYYLHAECFGRVRYDEPYWYTTGSGSRVYEFRNSQNGMPMLQYGSTFIDPIQYYCDNAVAQAIISNCAAPAGFIYGQ